MFISRGKECFTAENIILDVGMLNIGPTVDIIRDLFMHRITDMKGVGGVKSKLDGDIIPTPASVLAAGELLYRGTDRSEGIGPYMMADIGGATTDIYSFNENISYDGAKKAGLPEPAAKRTVEGDMGMRESSICLVVERGREKFAGECGITPEEIVEGQLSMDLVIEKAPYYARYMDWEKINDDAELLVTGANMFFERVMNALDDLGVDTEHAGER